FGTLNTFINLSLSNPIPIPDFAFWGSSPHQTPAIVPTDLYIDPKPAELDMFFVPVQLRIRQKEDVFLLAKFPEASLDVSYFVFASHSSVRPGDFLSSKWIAAHKSLTDLPKSVLLPLTREET
ncbi:hypothetical protein AVEN_148279-1, partial [Araneus ventricosus]